MPPRPRHALGWISFVLLFTAAGCTPRPYLAVSFRPETPLRTGAAPDVHLSVSDERPRPETLGSAARDKLPGFSGYFSLTVLPPQQPPLPLGARTLERLVESAFRQRLEAGGFRVAALPGPGTVEMAVHIESFRIDLEDGRWIFRFAYRASAEAGGRAATQTVGAEGERRRILGTREVEPLLDEVFTDAVNRLDIADLLERAGAF